MRLHRFFIEEQLRNKKDITLYDDEIIHQWKNVFRLRAGNQIILLDNSGFEYIAEIKLLAKDKAEVSIIDSHHTENRDMQKKEIWLFASLIKKDNYEWILEKGTEIGVAHFVPVISDRTEKKDISTERALKIIKEASEQSGRGIMPELHEVIDLKNIFENYSGENISFVAFHTEGKLFDSSSKFSDSFETKTTKIGILIGPEGGWSEKEIAFFKEKNIPLYTLGNQVLRAETAAIVISSLYIFS